MTDVIFGGSTPKGNVVWVPTALPALATTLLDPSNGVDPDSEVASQCQMPLHRAAVVRGSK
jgi:hypothetical protein